jgi:hypothetical protein
MVTLPISFWKELSPLRISLPSIRTPTKIKDTASAMNAFAIIGSASFSGLKSLKNVRRALAPEKQAAPKIKSIRCGIIY